MIIQPSNPILFWTCQLTLFEFFIFIIQKSFIKGACIDKLSHSPPLPKKHIKEMPILMHKYIDWNVNFKGEGNCRLHIVSALLDKGEENHKLFSQCLIKELKAHREITRGYTRIKSTVWCNSRRSDFLY